MENSIGPVYDLSGAMATLRLSTPMGVNNYPRQTGKSRLIIITAFRNKRQPIYLYVNPFMPSVPKTGYLQTIWIQIRSIEQDLLCLH